MKRIKKSLIGPSVWGEVSGARDDLPEGVHLDDGAPPTCSTKLTIRLVD